MVSRCGGFYNGNFLKMTSLSTRMPGFPSFPSFPTFPKFPCAKCRVLRAACRVPRAACRVPGAVCQVPSARCRVPGIYRNSDCCNIEGTKETSIAYLLPERIAQQNAGERIGQQQNADALGRTFEEWSVCI